MDITKLIRVPSDEDAQAWAEGTNARIHAATKRGHDAYFDGKEQSPSGLADFELAAYENGWFAAAKLARTTPTTKLVK